MCMQESHDPPLVPARRINRCVLLSHAAIPVGDRASSNGAPPTLRIRTFRLAGS